MNLLDFEKIYLVDCEYRCADGNLPDPVICLVAEEMHSGEIIKVWQDELHSLSKAPFDIGKNACFIAYNLVAEFSCFNRLGWSLPENALDLYVEFLNISNGFKKPFGKSLLSAQAYFGIQGISFEEKDEMRKLILESQNYSEVEKEKILDYCYSDVEALKQILPHFIDHPFFNTEFALVRGEYMKNVSAIEKNAIPLDAEFFDTLSKSWEEVKVKLIQRLDQEFNVFEDTTFRMGKFQKYLKTNEMSWPLLPSGKPRLNDETWKDQSKRYPKIKPLYELRKTLSKMKLNNITVGLDGRNRCSLFPFGSKTGRNQPSNSKFIFGTAKWLRHLIKPLPGHSIAYLDWSQQEFGVAAALSGDSNMMSSYQDSDPYLSFAKMAGAVPENATKESHPNERARFKTTVLAVQYQMGAESLSKKLGISKLEAQDLLATHRKVYSKFWEWSDRVVDFALLTGHLYTAFGWHLSVTKATKERTIRNFLMQANGAEILRVACCFAAEYGLRICATVHDAILIEAPTEEIEESIRLAQHCMAEASAVVLNGFTLKSDVDRFDYPNHYHEEDGEELWNKVVEIVKEPKEGSSLILH